MFIFLMALYFIASTCARLLTRVFTQHTKLDPYTANLLMMGSAYITGLFYGLSQLEGSLFAGVTPLLLLLVLFVGGIMTLFGKVSFIAQKHIDAAPFTVIRMLSVPVSVLLSTLFLGESLHGLQLIGMLSILIGVSIVSTGGKRLFSGHVGRYELLSIFSSVLLGVYMIYVRMVISQTSLATYTILFVGIESLPLLGVVLSRPKILPTAKDIKFSVGWGVASAIHIVAFWTAVGIIDNLATVSSVSAFRVVTIFAASYVLLDEKKHLNQKIAGSILAVIGLLLT